MDEWKQAKIQYGEFEPVLVKTHIGADDGYQAMTQAMRKAHKVRHVALSPAVTRETTTAVVYREYEAAIDWVAKEREYSYIANDNDPVRLARIERLKNSTHADCRIYHVPDDAPFPNFLVIDNEILFINLPPGNSQVTGWIEIRQADIAQRFAQYFSVLADECDDGTSKYQLHLNGRPVAYPDFHDDRSVNYNELIRKSLDISCVDVTGHRFLRASNEREVVNRLNAGGKLRLALLQPNASNLEAFASWSPAEQEAFLVESISRNISRTASSINRIRSQVPENSIEIRLLSHMPPFTTVQFDPDTDGGAILFSVYRAGLSIDNANNLRPGTLLKRDIFTDLYEHFRRGFNSLWDYAIPISLDDFISLSFLQEMPELSVKEFAEAFNQATEGKTHIDSLDVFSHSGGTTLPTLRKSGIAVKNVRILMRRIADDEIFQFPVIKDSSSIKMLEGEVEDACTRLSELHKAQKIENPPEIHYYSFDPISYFVVINKTTIVYGLYNPVQDDTGVEKLYGVTVNNTTAMGKRLIHAFDKVFDSVWRNFSKE